MFFRDTLFSEIEEFRGMEQRKSRQYVNFYEVRSEKESKNINNRIIACRAFDHIWSSKIISFQIYK